MELRLLIFRTCTLITRSWTRSRHEQLLARLLTTLPLDTMLLPLRTPCACAPTLLGYIEYHAVPHHGLREHHLLPTPLLPMQGGYTASHGASPAGFVGTMKQQPAEGAKVDARTKVGLTDLHACCGRLVGPICSPHSCAPTCATHLASLLCSRL